MAERAWALAETDTSKVDVAHKAELDAVCALAVSAERERRSARCEQGLSFCADAYSRSIGSTQQALEALAACRAALLNADAEEACKSAQYSASAARSDAAIEQRP